MVKLWPSGAVTLNKIFVLLIAHCLYDFYANKRGELRLAFYVIINSIQTVFIRSVIKKSNAAEFIEQINKQAPYPTDSALLISQLRENRLSDAVCRTL